MASGAKDWTTRTDILFQTLQRLLTRPTYGPARSSDDVKLYNAVGTKTLVDVHGSGKIYGGFVNCDFFTNEPLIYIDGVDLFIEHMGMDSLYSKGVEKYPFATFSALKWDTVNNIFTWGILPNITFESEFKLQVIIGDLPSWVTYQVLYSLIT